MNGAIITASTIAPESTPKPVGLLERKSGMNSNQRALQGMMVFSTKGTMASMPHTPYTTEGMAASKSSNGLTTSRIDLRAYSAR